MRNKRTNIQRLSNQTNKQAVEIATSGKTKIFCSLIR